MAEEEATQRSPQLLELVSKSKRELEKRLDQITNKGDIRDKDEGDTICMIIVGLEVLENYYLGKQDQSIAEDDKNDTDKKQEESIGEMYYKLFLQ